MSALEISPPICVADTKSVLGECPLWHPEKRCLYWLDIKGGRLHGFRPDTEAYTQFVFEGMVSSIALDSEHDFLCTFEHGYAYLDLVDNHAKLTPLFNPEADIPETRFNDGKIGPDGAYWAGTLDNTEVQRMGQWWRLLPDLSCALVDSDYMVTNGPAFDVHRKRVYLTDSADQRIFVADLAPDGLTNKRLFREFRPEEGYPDGMCVDREGFLWIAFWDGACIRRFDPDGKQTEQAMLPVPRPTSVTLVENRIYVTSARIGLDASTLDQFPLSGGLFELQLSRPLAVAASRIFVADEQHIR